MRKITFILFLAIAITNLSAHPSLQIEEVVDTIFIAQSETSVSGRKPFAGETISGVVRDSEGPMMMVTIKELNSKSKNIANAVTDIDGKFSFKLVNPSDSLEVSYYGYSSVKIPILGSQYDILLHIDPKINHDSLLIAAEKYKPTQPISDQNGYPLLFLDNHRVNSDSITWKNIDPTKDTYSKEELSCVFGIDAGVIKEISVLRDKAAIEFWGSRGKNGVIEIRTKDFEKKNTIEYIIEEKSR